jgi:hypothetical protein
VDVEAPFVGMHTATTVVSADPSALNNTVGFCIDAGDLDSWFNKNQLLQSGYWVNYG